MTRLTIKVVRRGLGVDTVMVTGFRENDMKMLRNADSRRIRSMFVSLMDKYCRGIGSEWEVRFGLYNVWIGSSGEVFAEIGNSFN